jgi:hypothetical protein
MLLAGVVAGHWVGPVGGSLVRAQAVVRLVVMGEVPNSRRVGVARGITLGDRALIWMVHVGVNCGDMRGWPTLGGVAGDRDGFMSTGTLGSSSGMTCVIGSAL